MSSNFATNTCTMLKICGLATSRSDHTLFKNERPQHCTKTCGTGMSDSCSREATFSIGQKPCPLDKLIDKLEARSTTSIFSTRRFDLGLRSRALYLRSSATTCQQGTSAICVTETQNPPFKTLSKSNFGRSLFVKLHNITRKDDWWCNHKKVRN